MLHLDASQMAALTQAHFFARVAEFVREQALAAPFKEAGSDVALRSAVWAPHWPALRDATEHDAALFMCFLLACAVLKIDGARAAAAVRRSPRPAASMKLFLSERGLLRFSAFDVPDLVAPSARA